MTLVSKSFAILLTLLIGGLVHGSDLEQFRQLDKAQLRTAENAMDEYLEPGTARLLREPKNAAERYVAERQQRLARQMSQSGPGVTGADGEQTMALFWPAARATRTRVDANGRVHIECVPASAMLNRTLPDFRLGNSDTRAVR